MANTLKHRGTRAEVLSFAAQLEHRIPRWLKQRPRCLFVLIRPFNLSTARLRNITRVFHGAAQGQQELLVVGADEGEKRTLDLIQRRLGSMPAQRDERATEPQTQLRGSSPE